MTTTINKEMREKYIGRKVRIIEGSDAIKPYEGDKLGKTGAIAAVGFDDVFLVLLDGADKSTLWSKLYLEFLGGK